MTGIIGTLIEIMYELVDPLNRACDRSQSSSGLTVAMSEITLSLDVVLHIGYVPTLMSSVQNKTAFQ